MTNTFIYIPATMTKPRRFCLPEVDPEEMDRLSRQLEMFAARVNPSSASNSQSSSSQRSDRYHRRSASRALVESAVLTATPENQKLSPPSVPNAPMKPRNTTRKLNLPRKKLEYTEPEDEPEELVESGFFSSASPTSLGVNPKSSKICETPKTSRVKKVQLSRHNGRKNLTNCDKENDSNLINQTTFGHSSNNDTRLTKNRKKPSVLQNRSRLEESCSHQNQLLENHREEIRDYPSRDSDDFLKLHQYDGRWIQCCSKECSKWRFTFDYDEPTDVPDIWYCNMNTDTNFSSCDIPEEKIPEELEVNLIETKYTIGTIVWGHLHGYPWWPAIIDDCPEKRNYYELDGTSTVPIKYHVVFIAEGKQERAWIRDKGLKVYAKNSRKIVVKKTKFRSIDYKNRLDVACRLADQALSLSTAEKLKEFGWGSKNPRNTRNSKANYRLMRIQQFANKFNPGTSSEEIIRDKKIRESLPKKYKLGDLVWARPKSLPWWPAIIDNCPIVGQYYQYPESSRLPIEYNVIYLDTTKLEGDWLTEGSLQPFGSISRDKLVKKTKYGKIEYRRQLDDSCVLAEKAKLMTSNERVENFGFIGRSAITQKVVKKRKNTPNSTTQRLLPTPPISRKIPVLSSQNFNDEGVTFELRENPSYSHKSRNDNREIVENHQNDEQRERVIETSRKSNDKPEENSGGNLQSIVSFLSQFPENEIQNEFIVKNDSDKDWAENLINVQSSLISVDNWHQVRQAVSSSMTSPLNSQWNSSKSDRTSIVISSPKLSLSECDGINSDLEFLNDVCVNIEKFVRKTDPGSSPCLEFITDDGPINDISIKSSRNEGDNDITIPMEIESSSSNDENLSETEDFISPLFSSDSWLSDEPDTKERITAMFLRH